MQRSEPGLAMSMSNRFDKRLGLLPLQELKKLPMYRALKGSLSEVYF
jgi:hypothetical protein